MTLHRITPIRPSATNPAPRRIVLLAPDGTPETVLATPKASGIIEELRRLRKSHPGRSLAAEWQQNGKWVRWITTLEGT